MRDKNKDIAVRLNTIVRINTAITIGQTINQKKIVKWDIISKIEIML